MYPGHWAKIFPEKTAITISTTGQCQTFGELDRRSNQLARFWWEQGLREGDHVAVFLDNHLYYLEVAWAALRSGLYITPINWHLTTEEAAYILNDCDARSIVSSAQIRQAEALKSHPSQCATWLSIDGGLEGFDDYDETISGMSPEPLPNEPAGAYMLYSSGTTGRPKGIARPLSGKPITQQAKALSGLQPKLWGFDENSVYLSTAPLYHSAPFAFSNGTLIQGGSVVVMPKFDPLEALESLQKYAVTHSQWVPTMFARLLKLDVDRDRFDLSAHKVAIHAAAPCPRQVKEQMLDWWGNIIYEYYAGSEANGLTHVTSEEWRRKPGTVGTPIMGIIHICDEAGRELPVGEQGMIYFELPKLPFSYHKDDEKTKKVQHPHHPTWSALGDVGYLDEDGYLFLTDRATFMIISGGVNIYPQEIEDALTLHPKVFDVAVIGVPNEEMGEEVKAIVQLAEGVEPSAAVESELLAYARDHVAHYKCPKSVDFVDELPRLATGKLYKRLLKDRYWGNRETRIV